MVDSDVGMGDLSLGLEVLHVYGHAQMRSHVSPGMDCSLKQNKNPLPNRTVLGSTKHRIFKQALSKTQKLLKKEE